MISHGVIYHDKIYLLNLDRSQRKKKVRKSSFFKVATLTFDHDLRTHLRCYQILVFYLKWLSITHTHTGLILFPQPLTQEGIKARKMYHTLYMILSIPGQKSIHKISVSKCLSSDFQNLNSTYLSRTNAMYRAFIDGLDFIWSPCSTFNDFIR